jgi:pimeloyl-ACP methyl ester carboxylesterase
MGTETPQDDCRGHYVHANGIDIHYVEAGQGETLLLIDNAMVSTNPIWIGHPFAYATHLEAFARHFRVIVPDTRGSGRTVHSGGPIPHTLLADDVVALIDALELDRPMICGFSDGGEVATIVGIRSPESVRAIVNHGGYDLFNPDPQAPTIALTRQMLGGSPDATQADFEQIARLAEQIDDMRVMWDLMASDHDNAQGTGHWQAVIAQTFDRISRPHGYTINELRRITAPTLILIGDRDPFCTVEEGASFYRALPDGEMAVLANTGHLIGKAAVQVIIEFLRRHLDKLG